MAIFGSDSKSSSAQIGADSGSAIASGKNSSIVYQFPDAVAQYAAKLTDLAQNTVTAAVGLARDAQGSLGDVASREKTPLTEWLPIIAVGAVGLVAVAYVLWRS